jgi:hypothetical protein
LGGDWESRFEDIDPEFHQLAGHPELLRHRHRTAGRLLAIPQGRVENIYAIAHRVVTAESIFVASDRFSKFILLRFNINKYYRSGRVLSLGSFATAARQLGSVERDGSPCRGVSHVNSCLDELFKVVREVS